MVENGDKWSKNGGACISWCAQDQSTGVMTRWCSGKTTNHKRRSRHWWIGMQYTPDPPHPPILVIRSSAGWRADGWRESHRALGNLVDGPLAGEAAQRVLAGHRLLVAIAEQAGALRMVDHAVGREDRRRH